MAFIRSRDIDNELKNRGMEGGTRYVLHVLAEQQIALQKDMRFLAQSVDQMANIISQFTVVADNMKQAVERLSSNDRDDMGLGPTQLIGE